MDVAGVSFRRIGLPNLSLHVAEAGPEAGLPTILLHGFPEFWYGWRHQIGPLAAAGLRVVVPDQRGYGLSDKPRGIAAYHLDRLADDVVALADACGFPTVRLVGHDWGGLVAWWVASRHPERIDRLAILNAPHPGIVGAYMRHHPGQMLRSYYVGLFQLPGLPERLLTADRGRALRRALISTSRPGAFAAADLDRYVESWSQPGAMIAMVNWYRALVRLPRATPPRVRVPALVLWGRQDTALQAGLAEASLDLCDDGRIRWYDRATHWLAHEEPDAVNADLLEFLA
ncbi:Pimeloyl-ACP methyl ester carboxylesterase [Methylobacterium phyllostachyos]|uniref:Pimeloyl-ACP methyl ester carboxylesterase n=1 Tax=Methylobacterium phyllostachyos TaxID=582672 RepID=A0A1G9TD66_9HYPH|nr:alpha/beta fold hydrolase [Methylobacterium phyllostachyos]SDM45689.1 Pimeloyl-ACP methyl ester carboxylesterase [Methylobacterium phyllostachyos]